VGRRFYTWFYQIVLHLAIDALRKRREQGSLHEDAGDSLRSPQSEPVEQLARDETADRVQALLARLPPRQRAILVLRDIEGFTAKEISDIIQTNHATVRWWLFLARKVFREEWERRYGKEDPCV
jgi:RNA polymerase sigma-70 factor (ECF subfamily)